MRQIDGTDALPSGASPSATEARTTLVGAAQPTPEGFKFRRQTWIGSFIADFCCMERESLSKSTVAARRGPP